MSERLHDGRQGGMRARARVLDLPVAVDLPPPLDAEVATYLEGELGWQVVGLEGPPRPVLVIAVAPVPGRASVVVAPEPVAAADVRAGFQAGALDVVAWPGERARLHDAAGRVLAAPAPGGGGPLLVRVAGTGGGAGTSTVALALAGLLAWSGRRAIVLGGEDLLRLAGLAPWRGPGGSELALLDPHDAAGEVEALARPVPGVPGLRAIGGEVSVPPVVTGWPGDVVVADLRAGGVAECDLWCARPDAHLEVAAGSPAPLALCGEGPLGAAGVRRVLGRPPAGRLAGSARVARAGVRGRVPADLPGSWLAALRAIAVAVRPGQRARPTVPGAPG